jgi:hypothetical protein
VRAKILGWIGVALLAAPAVSNAELYLVDNGEGPRVVDTMAHRTWLADLSLSGQVTFSGAVAWVDNLNATNYGGYSNWRFPFVTRYQDLLVTKMQNEMWYPPNRLPFLNAPTKGVLFSDTLEEETTSCMGEVWGE